MRAYSNGGTRDRQMRVWLMWRFAELNRERPLPGWRRHLRWCGLCSAAARGVFGNTQWAASMHAKNVASYRWDPHKRYLSRLKRLTVEARHDDGRKLQFQAPYASAVAAGKRRAKALKTKQPAQSAPVHLVQSTAERLWDEAEPEPPISWLAL